MGAWSTRRVIPWANRQTGPWSNRRVGPWNNRKSCRRHGAPAKPEYPRP